MPPLGTAVRRHWRLEPGFCTVNHGSYGATPLPVLAAQDAWRARMEAQPTRFFNREMPPALRASAARLAGFLGAHGDDLAFVENATAACNAVLRSLDLGAGDEIVVLAHGYGAVVNTARHVAARAGARVVVVPLPFPAPDAAALLAALRRALSPRTRIAVLDHITSSSALVLPVAAMAAACREAAVPVLIDGAHGPGQLPLDIPATGADWYAGNCHKWLMAPKGCGFLWARPERQAGLHPPVISHGLDAGFLAEFDWTGTRDPSAWLAIDAALDFHASLGGNALMTRNAELAEAATAMLGRRFNSERGPCDGAMGVVRLPVAGHVTRERALAIRGALLDAGTDAPVQAIDGGAWLRVSAAAYNEAADYARLADMIATVLRAQGD